MPDWLSAFKTQHYQRTPMGFAFDVHITSDLTWFSGHFEDQPVLPGIALIAFIDKALRQYFASNHLCIIPIQLKSVRFKEMIFPHTKLLYEIKEVEREPNWYYFTIKRYDNNNTICQGKMGCSTI